MVLTLISGIYAIVMGIGIIGLWTMFILTKQIPELQTEPVAIKFHIAAESSMGLISILSGIFLLVNLSWGIYIFLLAMGLIIYSAINSAGYYGQKKQWSFVFMFGVILCASICLVILDIIFLTI
ncbi:MAG: hypothetical protein ACTSSG_12745 [Candidatus Heimdallarchaeaceae archaeon]